MHKKLLSVVFIWLCALSSMADTLRIVEPFRMIEHASVLASYRNEFGSYRKPNMDVEFPYALIRVHIEGNESAVTKAKERFALYLGQHYTTKAKNTSRVNEIMFLVPVGAGHVELQCGDGCQPQTLFDYPQLDADAIYEGRVRYALEKVAVQQEPDPVSRQFFKFRVTPQDAIVSIIENGQTTILPMKEGGLASKMLNYGSYSYQISADRYYTAEGMFTVSDSNNELVITLRPKFGWLQITGDPISENAYVFATNLSTGGARQLGTIPLKHVEMDAGNYSVRVQKEKYKDYEAMVTIREGEIATIRPVLEANFVRVTLTTQNGADIVLDGVKLGTGKWTGTLEKKEHILETRQLGHHAAYTKLLVTGQMADQSIPLNNPQPIYGALIIDGSPADATVYVDGNKMGTTPLMINKLLVGSHKIRLEKDGYEKYEKTMTIAEGQETTLSYNLVKAVPTETINISASSSSSDSDDEVIFTVVETMPEFPGGQQAMMQFLGENIIYPPEAQKYGIQGRVICQFVVNKDGSIGDVNVIRSSGDASLDKEAIRVIQTMPRWKPGMQRGKPVRVKYTVPLNFRLQ